MGMWRPNYKIGGKMECLVGLKDRKGTGFGKGFFEVNGKLFAVSYSNSNKEGVTGWVRVTDLGRANTRGGAPVQYGQGRNYGGRW